MNPHVKHKHLIIFSSVLIAAWIIGTFAFVYYHPQLIYNALEKAVTGKGLTPTGVPLNTLYAEPQLASASSTSRLLTTGANNDTLYVGGALDLSTGPQILHVPNMTGRYYSIQFTDPFDGTDFAYIGTRTTGMAAGDYLITGPGWKGAVPQGVTQISSPNNSVLVIGRVLVESDTDLSTAYGLAQQIRLMPLSP